MKIEQEMTIYTAADLWKSLSAYAQGIPNGENCKLDLSGVPELDTAGAQILLMTRTVAVSRGNQFYIENISQPAKESLDLLGLASNLLPAGS